MCARRGAGEAVRAAVVGTPRSQVPSREISQSRQEPPLQTGEGASVSGCTDRRTPQQMQGQRLQERGQVHRAALPWGRLREGPARHLDTPKMPLLVSTKPQPESAHGQDLPCVREMREPLLVSQDFVLIFVGSCGSVGSGPDYPSTGRAPRPPQTPARNCRSSRGLRALQGRGDLPIPVPETLLVWKSKPAPRAHRLPRRGKGY